MGVRWVKRRDPVGFHESTCGRFHIMRHYEGAPWKIADDERPGECGRSVWVEHKGRDSWATLGAAKAVAVYLANGGHELDRDGDRL